MPGVNRTLNTSREGLTLWGAGRIAAQRSPWGPVVHTAARKGQGRLQPAHSQTLGNVAPRTPLGRPVWLCRFGASPRL